ncbi:hypothetical protein HWD35_06565 [Tsukamurella tyrosinosolvens]|uniref:Uncharacterized protein n=1 Tax=Tsukamurella tyrosinosolvens TaxID=57704 RepID=A0A1H4Z5D5_TSUTY|nr:hypothetical protein [Tsukamurella tyrosinosolvens]KXO90823.1 hypothetical protein AXK58_22510 [Tsukamurella tyrosinosolvens]KXP07012.1 hypothetical protein AXK59_02610 [Tsukamurella tyrosinosolvens]KZL98213.1 hypothetical protein AXX05_04760 [Tsukamurella tyrosinosolvens]MCA4994366.1 hypothetical protein [Tsukamurella tyrosinosolvens]MEC4611911.1 hypothetical protein [Tsukamurella tyrosinosolvens]
MSADRDELRRLVDEMPDADVAHVLTEVKRHLAPVPRGTWPPAWFGSIEGDGTAVGARADEFLAEGFGR